MNIRRKIYTGLIIASVALLYTECEQRSNTATETSATGRTADESANTERETPVKLKEYLPGDWTLDAAAAGGGGNNTAQRITFTREGKYLRYAGQQQTDSGLYRVNEQQKILYLESRGEGDPVEWDVKITDNYEMTLASRDEKSQGKSKGLVYRRK